MQNLNMPEIQNRAVRHGAQDIAPAIMGQRMLKWPARDGTGLDRVEYLAGSDTFAGWSEEMVRNHPAWQTARGE